MLSYIKLAAKRSKAVNHLVLNREETRVLVSLAAEPKPAGDIAPDVLSTLFSYNLAVELMGHCRITPRGQLELHRQRFRKSPGRKVAKVTPSSPLFLQEAAFVHNAPTRAKLREFVSRRRQESRLPFFGAPWANRQPVPEDDFPDEVDPLDIETPDSTTTEFTDDDDATVVADDELTTDECADDEASKSRDIIGEIIAEFQIDDTVTNAPDDNDESGDDEAILDLSESAVIASGDKSDVENDNMSAMQDEEVADKTCDDDDAIDAFVTMALKDDSASEPDVAHENAGDDILELSLEDLINLPPEPGTASRVDDHEEDAYQLALDLGLPDEGDENADFVLDGGPADDQSEVTDTESEQVIEEAAETEGDGEDAPSAEEAAENTDNDIGDDNKVVQWSRLVGRRRAREIPKPTAVQAGDEKDAVSD